MNLNDDKAKAKLDNFGKELNARLKALLAERLKLFDSDPFAGVEGEGKQGVVKPDSVGAANAASQIITMKLPPIILEKPVIDALRGIVSGQRAALQSRFLREAPGRSQDPMVRQQRHNARMLEEQRMIRAAAVRTAEATERTADELEDDEGAEGAGF